MISSAGFVLMLVHTLVASAVHTASSGGVWLSISCFGSKESLIMKTWV